MEFEIKRKLFHLLSLVFPILYLFVSKQAMAVILIIITSITLFLDISRHYNTKIKVLVEIFFYKLFRQEEKSGVFMLSGASYMALGFLLSCLFFSTGLTITSWLVLIISDCCAAVIGIKYGRPLANGKSFEGLIAFFISAVFVSILTYYAIGYSTSFLIIIIASAITSLIEFLSKEIKVNDNLAIPFAYALITASLSMFS